MQVEDRLKRAVEPVPETWQIRILFDAECPLCAREGRLLERLDRGRGRVQLEDISHPAFDASRYGLDPADLEARLHGVLPDGKIVEGVEVLARAYEAVDLGWLVAPARWPGFRFLLDRAYLWFARNRLRLTGREPKYCPRD
jgi:predicted DCC family thiol-disulfide oxidoreductase YuxK